MNSLPAACAIISADEKFVDVVRSSPPFRSGQFRVAVEISTPCADITDVELEELRAANPDVIVLDLEPNIPIGLKFAQFLAEAELGKALVASAPPLSPELLMEAMHAGVTDFLPKPASSEGVENSLDHARRKLGRKAGDQGRGPGRVVVYFSAKGGTGCTTLCTNTAIEVHRATREKTLLVDLDLELGETALQLGEEPRFSMVDLVRNFHRVDSDLLASYIEHHASGVDLLSAPYQPADFEAVSGDLVGRIISFLRRQYDWVFVDAPKTLNPATISALETADSLMVVTTADVPSLRNLTRCLPLLKQVGGDRTADWIRVVVNRHEPKGVISLEQVEETAGHEVFAAVRNDYRTVMNALNQGEPAVMGGGSDFAADVRRLAGRVAGVEPEPRKKRGWLRGLVGSLMNGDGGTTPSTTEARNRG
jgi:pilus assembly protein CpaE